MSLVPFALTVFGILALQDDIAKSAFNPEIPQLLPGAPGFSQNDAKKMSSRQEVDNYFLVNQQTEARREGGGTYAQLQEFIFLASALLACLLVGCSYFASGVC